MRNDIMLDAAKKLPVNFFQGESDMQHIQLLVELQKGELREFPWVGFGINRFGKAITDLKKFNRELKVELENDGYKNPSVTVKEDLSEFKISI